MPYNAFNFLNNMNNFGKINSPGEFNKLMKDININLDIPGPPAKIQQKDKSKKAWLCPHIYRIHYARGKCQNCYLNFYHKVFISFKIQEQCKNKKKQSKSDEEDDLVVSEIKEIKN